MVIETIVCQFCHLLERHRKGSIPFPTLASRFDEFLALIPEPFATMLYVAVYTGLRVNGLVGLRWNDVLESGISIDERCCRGDCGAPKSDASNATIAVNPCVVERIHRLKLLTVGVIGWETGQQSNPQVQSREIVRF
jgi:hypothetical protein